MVTECHLQDYVTWDSDLSLAERFSPLQGLKEPSVHVGRTLWQEMEGSSQGLRVTPRPQAARNGPSTLQPQELNPAKNDVSLEASL